ncbi:MAG: 2-C-methyl-D-erythritol 2,4-cyclodiphosphate synthase [Phycisphaerae bacterium]|nr:2-C-methyl-D-erythritol 2,4-cyclodiphosphate synthase [Phycisphaerae bacterium]
MIEDHDHEYRTGIGTDIHRLVPGRRLMLGGLHVPFGAGLAGHSDGDVVLHAVMDAMLGAATMGDIGELFPDTDPEFKDADSKELTIAVKELLEEKRWLIVNVDIIIHAEQPHLKSVKPQIKRCIASLLGVDFMAVNVKAKTNEGLGEVGTGQAIAATAMVLLKRKYKRTL